MAVVALRLVQSALAERRLHAPDAADAGDVAEPLEIGERGDHGLLAAHGEMRQPFEARKNAAVFLREVQQRAEHGPNCPRDSEPAWP